MERLIIKKFVLGIMSTNCYLIENNNHSILIDPGDKAELLINYLTQNNLQLTAILLTHGHFDHIGAIDELVEKYNCPVYIHQDDYEMIYNDQLNLSNYYGELKIKSKVTAVDDMGDYFLIETRLKNDRYKLNITFYLELDKEKNVIKKVE